MQGQSRHIVEYPGQRIHGRAFFDNGSLWGDDQCRIGGYSNARGAKNRGKADQEKAEEKQIGDNGDAGAEEFPQPDQR